MQTPLLVDDVFSQRGAAAASFHEVFRLALVGGLIAAAIAADLARSALPQPKPVAVGAALLGALVVLRRPSEPASAKARQGTVKQPRGRRQRRADRGARGLELEKPVSASGMQQALFERETPGDLTEIERRLQALERAIDDGMLALAERPLTPGRGV